MSLSTSRRIPRLFILLLMVLMFTSWLALFAFSSLPISATDALSTLWHMDEQQVTHLIVRDIRLPRALEAILIGASLSCAGALMQGLTRNPLASPSLFGVNAGAALGMALVSTVFTSTFILTSQVAAMLGGLSAWTLVMVLGGAWKMGSERGQLVLAGLAISALCSALTKACVILVEEQAASVMTWLAGSFAHVGWETWQMSWPGLSAALVLGMLLAPKLNILVMGDERVKSLGVNLTLLRILVGLIVLTLVGISVSMVGAIAFIGLIVPHMARFLVGYDHRILLPTVMLLGAILALAADILSRMVVFPTETPAGAVLALIGAPYFLYLVRKQR
ncbi:iron-dicitrate transporter permease subunit [Vibrio cincinnatiensis]|uniref:iron chelate uptake ABC transporter family permease subunit n=1 Tax=Vibrio cincinnatiensis TaxID=675 RepID=UPI001EE0AE04|nr:iron chelate uptake ABC transporter family permease subunit [Vibrio cincinnatiensis]MCG3760521.1 iron-dicitrate transporter permease subunit [Vibrio cincinnatiensis]MCG3763831.1 iron-dicitrate transporter permease subunit [Vibrio cincinnatiensis]